MQNFSYNETTNGTDFAETADNVFIPILTSLLNVFGNCLAIACLMHYKLTGNSSSAQTRRSQINWSHDRLNSTTETQMMEERRLTGDSHLSRRSRKQVVKFGMFHTLVSILAVLDLCGTLCTSPVTIILYIREQHIEDYGGYGLCYYSAFALLYLGLTTMAMVMAMSVERLFSIRFAFLYRQKASASKAMCFASIIFLFSAVFCALPAFGFGKIRAMYPYSWCYADWNAKSGEDKAFNYLYVSLAAVMLLTTLLCNALVIKGLIKMRRLSSFRTSRRRFFSRESQMIIQLLVITVIFIICWTPLMIRILINTMGSLPPSFESDRTAIWLAIVNPILDPWVYILCRQSVFQRVNNKIKNISCMRRLQTTTPIEEIQPEFSLRPSPRIEKLKEPRC